MLRMGTDIRRERCENFVIGQKVVKLARFTAPLYDSFAFNEEDPRNYRTRQDSISAPRHLLTKPTPSSEAYQR